MCGIVGYAGHRNAASVLVSGLRRLEYRGYDSAGVALLGPDSAEITLVRTPGKIADLEAKLKQEHPNPLESELHVGIGHTRWATHGPPTEQNAHPHVSQSGTFAIVHNGIIDNYADIKAKLTDKGFTFSSQTDSEAIAHLIEYCYDGDFRSAVTTALKMLRGTYGIAVISPKHPDTIIAARKGSPIALGICENETIIASDISAIVKHTKQVVFLDDNDVCTATAGTIEITSLTDASVSRQATEIDWDTGEISKGGKEHFMLKEIHEQPEAIANTLRGRLLEEDGVSKLSGLQMEPAEMARISRIVIAACGTSYYAGNVAKYLFEDFAGIPAEVTQAAEFRDRSPMIQPDTCLIAVSQSGETADTLAAVREAKQKGATILGVCNVVGSTIAREAGRGVYLHAGPEIGVASTKAFTCQVAVLAMIALAFGRTRRLSVNDGSRIVREIARLPDLVQAVLDKEEDIIKIAEKYYKAKDFFFIGRGYTFPAAMEGALKLKEISYIHAEGYHAAELKHGPIALLDESVPIVIPVPDSSIRSKTLANMQECRARKAPVIAIATSGDSETRELADDLIEIPGCEDFVSAVPVVIAEQLLAYHIARLLGRSIDQPRNLAKSVTVE